MRAHEVVDRALGGPAVVVGSLPPGGRDLDVLVRDRADARRVGDALAAAGFAAFEEGWLRFAHGTAELVELVPAARLGLRAAAVEALCARAVALDGCRHLSRPCPGHAVLLLAIQAAMAGELPAKRRRRLASALAEDPAAWERAAEEAPAWEVAPALDALAQLAADPVPADAQRRSRWPPSGVRVRLGAARDLLRGRRRGAVIALSGLDGAGKSTQAMALARALEHLGHPVAVEWARLGDGARSWERLPPALRATALTLEHLWTLRRRLGGFLARRYVVVCDRYTLDAIVALRGLTGEDRRVPLRRALLRALTRRPAVAFLLDVDPDTAWGRKGEQDPASLRHQRALYLDEHRRQGVELLDGERPADELAAHIARRAWQALGPPRWD